jgi:triacylglycerol lipase
MRHHAIPAGAAIRAAFSVLLACLLLLLSACAAPRPQPCPADKPVDLAEALDLAGKSDRAYLSEAAIRGACGSDSCFIVTGAVTGARVFVQRDDVNRLQWAAFRGTQNTADAKLDARYTHVADSSLGMPLHEGFAAGVAELLPSLMTALRPGYRTRFTGHSLGGAMAVVAALELKAMGVVDARVVTFGQPKVTNGAGARKAAAMVDLTRFVHGGDLVAQAPPLSWKPGGRELGSYAHFGREVLLGEGGFTCHEGHVEDPLDLSRWRDPVGLRDLKDHRVAEYLNELDALMLSNPPPASPHAE